MRARKPEYILSASTLQEDLLSAIKKASAACDYLGIGEEDLRIAFYLLQSDGKELWYLLGISVLPSLRFPVERLLEVFTEKYGVETVIELEKKPCRALWLVEYKFHREVDSNTITEVLNELGFENLYRVNLTPK